MTKILDTRKSILGIETRRVSSEILEKRIGYRVLADACFLSFYSLCNLNERCYTSTIGEPIGPDQDSGAVVEPLSS